MEKIIALLPVAHLAIILVPLLIIDAREHRLPNKIVLPLIAITFLSQLVSAIFYGAWATFGISLGLSFAALLLGLYMNYKQSLGMGDVKLIAGLTMLLSSFTVLGAVLLMPLSIAIGFISAVIVVLSKREIRTIPLGPVIITTFALLFITLELV